MRFGRNKTPPEQPRARQARTQERPAKPAFSYYTNRPAEPVPRRVAERQNTTNRSTERRQWPRVSFGQLPFWLLMAVVAVCLGKLLLLSTSPKVVVVGQNGVTAAYQQPMHIYEAAAGKVLASSITNRTKLTANVTGTSQALEHQFPELQTVSVTLPLMGNRPIVYVAVAQPSLVLQTSHGNYAVNKSGVVLAKLRTLPADVPQVADQTGNLPQPGKQFLPSSIVSFVQMVAYQFKAASLVPAAFVLPQASPYELDVPMEGKPYTVKFNLQDDPRQQSGVAIATLQHLGSTTPSAYLDVRVPERVYYK